MEKKFGTKKTSEITGISPDLIRKYCTYFNIQVERKKLENGDDGHRQFSKENIEELLEIKDLVNKNVSWENIRAARNGEEEVFVPTEQRSNLESKLDQLLEQNKEQADRQNEFNRVLLESLSEMTQQVQIERQRNDNLERKNQELEKKVLQIEYKDENKDENETDKIEKKVTEKKKSFFSRFFK